MNNSKINANLKRIEELQAEIGPMETAHHQGTAKKDALRIKKKARNVALKQTKNQLNKEQIALAKQEEECKKLITDLQGVISNLTKKQTNLNTQVRNTNKAITNLKTKLNANKDVLENKTKEAKSLREKLQRMANNNGPPPPGGGGGSNSGTNRPTGIMSRVTGALGAMGRGFRKGKNTGSPSSTPSSVRSNNSRSTASSTGSVRSTTNIGNYYNEQIRRENSRF